MENTKPHFVRPEHAQQVYSWLQSRGGIRIWHSIDLSDPGYSMTTPADRADTPHWKLCNADACRIITDESLVVVGISKEIRRFHIALRRSDSGLSMKCTSASSEKIRKACAKAGPESWYDFDYMSQEAIIYIADSTMPIKQFVQFIDDNHVN